MCGWMWKNVNRVDVPRPLNGPHSQRCRLYRYTLILAQTATPCISHQLHRAQCTISEYANTHVHKMMVPHYDVQCACYINFFCHYFMILWAVMVWWPYILNVDVGCSNVHVHWNKCERILFWGHHMNMHNWKES